VKRLPGAPSAGAANGGGEFANAMSEQSVVPMDGGASQETGLAALLGGSTVTEQAPAEVGGMIGEDDLTKIEGIGPAIAGHLKAAGINRFSELAATTPERIKEILDAVGGYGAHDPSTWPDQAQLAATGEWGHLKEWQDQLDGGREVGGESAHAAVAPTDAPPAVSKSEFLPEPPAADVLTTSGLATDVSTPAPEMIPPTEAPASTDDLTKIEGIGPKIAEHLNANGVNTFAQLAAMNPAQVKVILDAGGFAAHDPGTWGPQAEMASAGQWDKLSAWQDELDGGKIVAADDDLTKVEGIGPKVREILSAAGISTFKALSSTSPDKIKEILAEAGGMMATMNPMTWPDQAQLAAAGEWDKLKQWQDELDGGV